MNYLTPSPRAVRLSYTFLWGGVFALLIVLLGAARAIADDTPLEAEEPESPGEIAAAEESVDHPVEAAEVPTESTEPPAPEPAEPADPVAMLPPSVLAAPELSPPDVDHPSAMAESLRAAISTSFLHPGSDFQDPTNATPSRYDMRGRGLAFDPAEALRSEGLESPLGPAPELSGELAPGPSVPAHTLHSGEETVASQPSGHGHGSVQHDSHGNVTSAAAHTATAHNDPESVGQSALPHPFDTHAPPWARDEGRDRIFELHAEAVNAARRGLYDEAEHFYIRLLNLNLRPEERRNILLELAVMLEQRGIEAKMVTVYERYIEEFPSDPYLPRIHMRLGQIYRDMGAFSMALQRFYAVLNVSINIPPEAIADYRRVSMQAQIEIAETQYTMGDFEAASEFYRRLSRLDLDDEDRALVEFKLAYSEYLLGQHASVVVRLRVFNDNYPSNPLVPESHFLLANAHKRLGQPRDAVDSTLALLNHESLQGSNPRLWDYWKKRTGNQLANEFYEQGDYMNALRIYQAMAPLSGDATWQWPVIYQIGLCWERLRFDQRAYESFDIIAEAGDWHGSELVLDDNLTAIREMATWRRDHLRWATRFEDRLDDLLTPVTSTQDS